MIPSDRPVRFSQNKCRTPSVHRPTAEKGRASTSTPHSEMSRHRSLHSIHCDRHVAEFLTQTNGQWHQVVLYATACTCASWGASLRLASCVG